MVFLFFSKTALMLLLFTSPFICLPLITLSDLVTKLSTVKASLSIVIIHTSRWSPLKGVDPFLLLLRLLVLMLVLALLSSVLSFLCHQSKVIALGLQVLSSLLLLEQNRCQLIKRGGFLPR